MTNIDALSWSDVKSSQVVRMAILPWGATEPHNLHLSYSTDNLLSRAVSLDAAAKAEAQGVQTVVLPAIPFGSQNPGQTDLPLCIHMRVETQKAILYDVVSSLKRSGINKLLIMNGHGGNTFNGVVRDLAVDFPDFLIAISDWYKVVDSRSFFTEPGDHAGELETSMMLHYYPEYVKPKEVYGSGTTRQFTISGLNKRLFWLPRNWQRVSDDTGIGNPQHANAEKGKLFADAVSTVVAEFIRDFANADPDKLYC